MRWHRTCPVCGKWGFISRRWVRSRYYPKYASIAHRRLEEAEKELAVNPKSKMLQEAVRSLKERIRGIRFKGDSRKHLQGEFWAEEEEEAYNNKENNIRITHRYYYPYFGHYSPEKYEEQMKKYKQGLRKSRPNGRIWHQVPKHIINNNYDYWMVACGRYRRPRF